MLAPNLLPGIFFFFFLNRAESLVGKRILAVKLLQYTTTLNIWKITIYNVLKVFKKLFLKNKVLKKVIIGARAQNYILGLRPWLRMLVDPRMNKQ